MNGDEGKTFHFIKSDGVTPLIEQLDRQPERVKVKPSDGDPVHCSRCRTWIAVVIDGEVVTRKGVTGIRSHQPGIADGAVFVPTSCRCGAFYALDPSTGEILEIHEPPH
jgi:hypothetical protein